MDKIEDRQSILRHLDEEDVQALYDRIAMLERALEMACGREDIDGCTYYEDSKEFIRMAEQEVKQDD